MNIKNKFTIAHIITGLYTGGAEMMLYNLLSRTNRDRFQPIVISLMDRGTLSDRIEALGIPVYTIGMKPGQIPTPGMLLRLFKTINQYKPDVVQGWMYHSNLAAWFGRLVCAKNSTLIWNIHHSISGLSYEKRMTQFLIRLSASISKSIHKVIFVSHNSKDQHESLGYSRANTCVIPNGFDTFKFKPSEQAREELRAELNLEKNAFLIGLICRYHPMKDHENFLKAASLLQIEYPNVHFILVGTNVDRDNQQLQELIQQLKISNIHLLGERKDIPMITAALDIASSSSAYGEAFPMIAGEAMSCGVPCVVTDVGDSAWAVGNTGKVVPPRNPDKLADAWKELLLMSEEDRKALGQLARARIIECFSLDSVVAQFENLHFQTALLGE